MTLNMTEIDRRIRMDDDPRNVFFARTAMCDREDLAKEVYALRNALVSAQEERDFYKTALYGNFVGPDPDVDNR